MGRIYSFKGKWDFTKSLQPIHKKLQKLQTLNFVPSTSCVVTIIASLPPPHTHTSPNPISRRQISLPSIAYQGFYQVHKSTWTCNPVLWESVSSKSRHTYSAYLHYGQRLHSFRWGSSHTYDLSVIKDLKEITFPTGLCQYKTLFFVKAYISFIL